MDSTISALFSTIVGLELVMSAFAVISGLQDSFAEFVLESYGSTADTSSLMLRFQEVFLKCFRSKIEFIIRFQQSYVAKSSKLNYEIITKAFLLDTEIWQNAFIQFKNIIRSELNMRTSKFEYALDNITAFSDRFNKYMANFAKTNQISEDSDMYLSKFNDLKQWLQNAVDKRINDHLNQHNDICADMGYEDGCPEYELCGSCTLRRKNTWLKRLNEYIQSEFDSFETIPIVDVCHTELDEKESRRDDYTKRTKLVMRDKRRYLRNKGLLTKDNRKTIKPK
jgi:hypothetical protein